ncbi:MAG: glycosyltransferase family 2 protein [candidate division WOR-3 bacterium]|nr:glycosyltransferase family 2 protein [candidate division WOR-3 bacterium]
MKVGILIPAYNEVENIPHLISMLDDFIKHHHGYEVVFIDDGSTDGTQEVLKEYKRNYLKVARHKRNMGKTQAIITGAAETDADILVIYDADMQFDIEDVPKLVELIIKDDADVATGWKQGKYEKRFVSGVYNWCGRKLFNLQVHDMNAIKAFRREVLQAIPLRRDWHRYIVPLASQYGFVIKEIPVKLKPRLYGVPKYQKKSRILIGFFDLLAVKFQLSFLQKPLLYFGTTGMIQILLGIFVGIIAIILRLLGHGFRPMLYLVILLVVSGILFFALGLIGESIRAIIDRLEKLESSDRKNFL